MSFKVILPYWGKPEFKDKLSEYLAEHQDLFDFDEHCPKGGYPFDVGEFVIQSVEEDGGSIVAEGGVDFLESVSGGCADLPSEEPRYLSFTVTIDKKTGRGDVDADLDVDTDPGENY